MHVLCVYTGFINDSTRQDLKCMTDYLCLIQVVEYILFLRNNERMGITVLL